MDSLAGGWPNELSALWPTDCSEVDPQGRCSTDRGAPKVAWPEAFDGSVCVRRDDEEARGGEGAQMLTQREWIIQRCTQRVIGSLLEYEDWLAANDVWGDDYQELMTEAEMLIGLEICEREWASQEFRGHNVINCRCENHACYRDQCRRDTERSEHRNAILRSGSGPIAVQRSSESESPRC